MSGAVASPKAAAARPSRGAAPDGSPPRRARIRGLRRARRGTPRRPPRGRRSGRAPAGRAAAPAPPRPTLAARAEARAGARPAVRSSPRRSLHPSRRGGLRLSSQERLAEVLEAARDAARDRSGRDRKRRADGAVALVTREEAVEDLLAVA